MTVGEFCSYIGRLELTNAQKAVSILWFLDQENAGIEKSARELTVIIKEYNIGSPNPTALNKLIRTTKCVYTKNGLFRVRKDKKELIKSWFKEALTGLPEEIPIQQQFLHEEVWEHTRGYIEKVCIQLNGAYHYGYYDCAAVMIRRLAETLIIVAYEEINRESEIKRTDGNYFMFGELVTQSIKPSGLSLGRDSKDALNKIKKMGDRSAHNRRYNAKKPDLDSVKDGLRLCVEELLNIANLYSKT